MTNDDIKALRADVVDNITPLLGDMSDADVTALRKLEASMSRPRNGLLQAIDAELAGREQAALPPAPEKPKRGSRSAVRDETPAWQKPDYSGPLTGDQAVWRHTRMVTK